MEAWEEETMGVWKHREDCQCRVVPECHGYFLVPLLPKSDSDRSVQSHRRNPRLQKKPPLFRGSWKQVGFLLWAPKAPSSVLPKESGRRRRPVRCPQKKPPLVSGQMETRGGFLLWNYTDIILKSSPNGFAKLITLRERSSYKQKTEKSSNTISRTHPSGNRVTKGGF